MTARRGRQVRRDSAAARRSPADVVGATCRADPGVACSLVRSIGDPAAGLRGASPWHRALAAGRAGSEPEATQRSRCAAVLEAARRSAATLEGERSASPATHGGSAQRARPTAAATRCGRPATRWSRTASRRWTRCVVASRRRTAPPTGTRPRRRAGRARRRARLDAERDRRRPTVRRAEGAAQAAAARRRHGGPLRTRERPVVGGDEGVARASRASSPRRSATQPAVTRTHSGSFRQRGAPGGERNGESVSTSRRSAGTSAATSADASSPRRKTSPEKLIASAELEHRLGVVDRPGEGVDDGRRPVAERAAQSAADTGRAQLLEQRVLGVAPARRRAAVEDRRLAGLERRARGCGGGSPAGPGSG